MNKSEAQELLAALYRRLNGYFVSGFIVHAPVGNRTEIDILAVRFPEHKGPERDIGLCSHLKTPDKHIDFLVGEVKGGSKRPNFNSKFRECPEAIRAVLNRFGGMHDNEIDSLIQCIISLLDPITLKNSHEIPSLDTTAGKLRFVLFAPDQKRGSIQTGPVIFGDDMLQYIWSCLRPSTPRPDCATDYNRTLWGYQFNNLVSYFKSSDRRNPGSISELYQHIGCNT